MNNTSYPDSLDADEILVTVLATLTLKFVNPALLTIILYDTGEFFVWRKVSLELT